MAQGDVIKFRPARVQSGNVLNPPTNGAPAPGPGTDRIFGMSPMAPSGLATQGFIFMLGQPSSGAATAGAGGFAVTIWFRDGVSYRWGSSVTVSVSYGQMWICNDVDAVDGVYFQVGNVSAGGNIDIHFSEQ